MNIDRYNGLIWISINSELELNLIEKIYKKTRLVLLKI